MKPFKLNPKQAAQAKRDVETKDKLVLAASRKVKTILEDGVEQVFANYQKTGKYKDPKLSGLDELFTDFYVKVLGAAIQSCKQHNSKKKLAAAKPPDPELPDGRNALSRIMNRNSAFFQKIMKRKKVIVDAMYKQYLKNVKTEFKKMLPLLEEKELHPDQIKKKINETWGASVARSETIFRTESTHYFASAQVAYFQDSDDIIGYLFDSVRDTSRTPICKCRHGLVLKQGSDALAENTPPLHYNCRSHLIPLANDEANRKMMAEPDRQPKASVLNKKENAVMKGFSGH